MGNQPWPQFQSGIRERSKPHKAPKITTLPDDTLDLFDIFTNIVTKLNSQIAGAAERAQDYEASIQPKLITINRLGYF